MKAMPQHLHIMPQKWGLFSSLVHRRVVVFGTHRGTSGIRTPSAGQECRHCSARMVVMGLVLECSPPVPVRVLRGAKSPEELAEETAAREQILAFFKKQFARTDVPSIVSPKSNVPATATTPKAATSASAPPPPSTPTVRSGARGQAAPCARRWD